VRVRVRVKLARPLLPLAPRLVDKGAFEGHVHLLGVCSGLEGGRARARVRGRVRDGGRGRDGDRDRVGSKNMFMCAA